MAEAVVTQDFEILLELMLRQIAGFDATAVAPQLIAVSKQLFFREGDVLFEAGGPARWVYFVLEGAIGMEHATEVPWLINAPGMVGLLDAELKRPHSRTATATSDTRVAAVNIDDYSDIFQNSFALITDRVARVAELLNQFSEGLDHTPLMNLSETSIVGVDERAAELLVATPIDRMMNPFERLLMLRLCTLFAETGMQAVNRLAEATKEHHLEAGQQLYRAGAASSHLHIVAHGRVCWRDGDGKEVGVFEPPHALGGYLCLGLDSYPFDAVAAVRSRVLSLRIEDVYDILEDHHDASHSVSAFLLKWMEHLRSLAGGLEPPSPRQSTVPPAG